MTMAFTDPRLADPALLRLAAFRLTHGPRPLLVASEGLAALLDQARHLPQTPVVLESDRPLRGLALLLHEARQWVEEQAHARGGVTPPLRQPLYPRPH
jgi:hypothetical protein